MCSCSMYVRSMCGSSMCIRSTYSRCVVLWMVVQCVVVQLMVALCTVCRSINGHSLNIRFLRARSMNSLHGRSTVQVWVVGPCVVILWKTDVFYISVLFFPSGVTICVAVWPCIILHKIYWHGSAVHRFDILILKYDLSLDIFSQTALKKLIHFWCCGSPAGMARGANQNKLLWQMVIERQR